MKVEAVNRHDMLGFRIRLEGFLVRNVPAIGEMFHPSRVRLLAGSGTVSWIVAFRASEERDISNAAPSLGTA